MAHHGHMHNIGSEDAQNERESVSTLMRRYSSAADNIGNAGLDSDVSDEFQSEGDLSDQIGAATVRMLQPLRSQVGNIGVDIAVLDETLQTLISHTEGANKQIKQVTNFVVDLIERLEDIDEKARLLMDKWKEESSAICDFTDHADEVTERFSNCIKSQERKIQQLNDLLLKLEGETKRLSLVPSSGSGTKPFEQSLEESNLLVEDPENVDFHSKRKAFFVIAEKMKTNDTFKTFKADKEGSERERSKSDEAEHMKTVTGRSGSSRLAWCLVIVVSFVLIPLLGWMLYNEFLLNGKIKNGTYNH